MATPRTKAVLFALGVATLMGSIGASPAAQDARENLSISIDAASAEFNIRDKTLVMHDVTISQGDLKIRGSRATGVGGPNDENSKWTFIGDVRINGRGIRLQSDEAIVTIANNLVTRATVTGAPAQVEVQSMTGADPVRAHARTIDYDTEVGDISLMGEAWFHDGCKEFRIDQLVYNIKSQSMRAHSVAASGGSSNRVRVTILPQTPSGSPCAALGKK